MDETEHMRHALLEMSKSGEKVKVGAVIVINGKVVATGYRQRGKHAEREAIESARAQGLDLRKATLYTTLEPCVTLSENQGKKSCADLIIESKIREVVIGRYDPNPNVNRRGWKNLRDAGIWLRDFPKDLRDEIDNINQRFMSFFAKGIGPSGGAKINHRDKATFHVQFAPDDFRGMDICWTVAGVGSAHAYANRPVRVALARFASDFDEVDDPTAFEFSHSVNVKVGEIGIFWGPAACVLVKPKCIQSGPDYGSNDYFVQFDYIVRVLEPCNPQIPPQKTP
ncbi:deaminase [Pseudomonas entomophila]|uniref:deaminase n=1 Tax=Pseudomonas entomophila TaxID=312306 RepID=UPI0023D7F498|nr:deaminase [Pseudomonas entomophila]MDF0730015.1 deaminase [Pseudomonas entomophila]